MCIVTYKMESDFDRPVFSVGNDEISQHVLC